MSSPKSVPDYTESNPFYPCHGEPNAPNYLAREIAWWTGAVLFAAVTAAAISAVAYLYMHLPKSAFFTSPLAIGAGATGAVTGSAAVISGISAVAHTRRRLAKVKNDDFVETYIAINGGSVPGFFARIFGCARQN